MKKQIAVLAAATVMCGSLTACSNTAKTYTNYVQAVLDCTYRGETEEYINLTGSTDEDATAVYDDEVDYFTALLCYQMAVETDYISDETYAGYTALSKDILNKTQYTVEKAVKSGSAYHITIVTEPIDFWDITYDAVESYYTDEMADKFSAATTDEEIAELEEEYAEGVLDILSGYVSQIGYKDAVNKIVEITVDDDGYYGISDQDWYDIDDLLLDMNANT